MEEQARKTNPLFLYSKSLPQRVRGLICIKSQYGELLINNTKNVLSRGPKGCGLAKEEKISFFSWVMQKGSIEERGFGY